VEECCVAVMGHANIYVLVTDWLNEMNWQTMERSRAWESKHWKPFLWMMSLEVLLPFFLFDFFKVNKPMICNDRDSF
jgi:uncharacterized membrane protein (DUF2068 family)